MDVNNTVYKSMTSENFNFNTFFNKEKQVILTRYKIFWRGYYFFNMYPRRIEVALLTDGNLNFLNPVNTYLFEKFAWEYFQISGA